MREPDSKVMKRFNYLLGEMDAVYHEMALKLGLSDSAMIILYTVSYTHLKPSIYHIRPGPAAGKWFPDHKGQHSLLP